MGVRQLSGFNGSIEIRTDISVIGVRCMRLKTSIAYHRVGRKTSTSRGYQGDLLLNDEMGIESVYDGLCDMLAQITQKAPSGVVWVVLADALRVDESIIVWTMVRILAHEFDVSLMREDTGGAV